MTAHRFYAGEGSLGGRQEGDEIALDASAAHRIARVLRMRSGEHITVFAEGVEFEAELTRVSTTVQARLLAQAPNEPAAVPLTLYQAVIRPNRFEWLLEKGTELGVTQFAPILTARSAHQGAAIGPARFERWQRIAIEASEQCGRRSAPVLVKPVTFQGALASAPALRVFAWERLRSAPHAGDPSGLPEADGYSLFIGPEGGWTEEEIQLARSAGAVFLNLGWNVLRSETAAIAATAMLLLAPGLHRAER